MEKRSLHRRTVLTGLTSMLSLGWISCERRAPSPFPSTTGSQSSKSPEQPIIAITGAGATFPALLYQRWFVDFNQINPSIQVNYQAVGTAAGIRQFIDNTTDFGASDIAMTDPEMAQVKQGALLIPMTAGSVVVCYNLPGISSGLKLSRSLLAEIFLGKITQWRDPKIAELNPDLSLPDLPIVVVYRADGSGTTATFTKHLSAINAAWKEQVGSGVVVNWPTGAGAKGNEGVSAQVQLAEGVIAYVEYVYAKELDLSMAALENQAGNYILPTPESALSALNEVKLPENLRAFVDDPTGSTAFPIVTYTWILAYRRYEDPNKAEALKQVLLWALTDGQNRSPDLGYLPLPIDVANRAKAVVEQIQT
ncbi:MAG: phosphate ABC transporter substrate-binding protein PstS [Cyanobacteriota bacterium]|nr:phosphate ABC transporter substrate-binding protein PstS [Cyanobacteriota bacterium]